MLDFPDLHHFDQIRQRLWCGREFGQAAVMVGAGFSCNAEKIAPSTPDFPLWGNLASDIYDELYPQIQWQTLTDEQRKANDKVKERALANPLALASEYEVTFGSPALQDLLIRSIPDNQYNPGNLHKLLMSLPWSDVFTTNYDTLLERTRPFIHDRKYDLICTTSDIPGRMKPRIVKLHGSFPSHRPFIITEEDFRTYPRKFAPFVNMVQQSIMENVFCLIGFSGEDPNFLNWIGWVRDNLGESTPPIYLCGLLDRLSESKKQILKQKNIITVDVSPMFPRSTWFDSNLRYSKSIEWLLLSLMNGKPLNIANWPNSQNGNEWQKSNDLPELVCGSKPLSGETKISEDENMLNGLTAEELVSQWSKNTGELNEKQLIDLYLQWSQSRKEYPGWIVCPQKNRETIWSDTKNWIWKILTSIDNLPNPEKIFLIYEINWRFEITLTPLPNDWIEKITSILTLYNPYPSLLELPEVSYHPSNQEFIGKNWNWNEIRRVWVELVFALIRAWRENNNPEQFCVWIEHIQKISSLDTRWRARYFYERCLFHLSRLEHYQAQKNLEQWSSTKSTGIWEIRRASIFAELGELKEAEKIAEEALSDIRSRFQPYSIDYELLSQEASAMYLLRCIQLNHFDANIDYQTLHQDRWQQLESYRCNVLIEIDNLQTLINKPLPSPKPYEEKKNEFYPGTFSTSYNLAGEATWYEYRPGLNVLRVLEEGGCPLRCGWGTHSTAIFNAAKWISLHSNFLSLSSILRIGDNRKSKDYFSFIRVAALEQKHVNFLFNSTFNFLIPSIHGQGITSISKEAHIYNCFAILSRLCIRLSDFLLEKLLESSIKIYKQIISLERLWCFGKSLNSLLEAIFYSLSSGKTIELIPKLLEVPLLGNLGSNKSFDLEEIFSFIRIPNEENLGFRLEQSSYANFIDDLLLAVRDGSRKSRAGAILRLGQLYELNALTDIQQAKFSEVLWAKIDTLTQLPSETGLLNCAFLNLPQPDLGFAKSRLKQYLLSISLPETYHEVEEFDKKFRATSGLDYRIFKEIYDSTFDLRSLHIREHSNLIDWSFEETLEILNKITSWWNKEKIDINESISLPIAGDSIKKCLFFIDKIFAIVVLPRLGKNSLEEDIQISIRELLSEIEEVGCLTYRTIPAFLFLDPNEFENVSRKLRTGLASINEKTSNDSVYGFLDWILFHKTCGLPSPPKDFFNELINRILNRRKPGLEASIDAISVLIPRYPEMLSESHFDALVLALEYLLQETKLPSFQELEITDEATYHNRPEHRQLASQLACHLYHLCEKQGKNIPEILIDWRNASQGDILPQVRKVWQ